MLDKINARIEEAEEVLGTRRVGTKDYEDVLKELRYWQDMKLKEERSRLEREEFEAKMAFEELKLSEEKKHKVRAVCVDGGKYLLKGAAIGFVVYTCLKFEETGSFTSLPGKTIIQSIFRI